MNGEGEKLVFSMLLRDILTKSKIVVNLTYKMVNQMKGKILKALRQSEDYVSGEMIAEELGISRVAVWKHIRDLKQDGYILQSSSKGYKLISSPDLLLPCEFPDLEQKIHHFREVSSTMDVARELSHQGAEEGTIVIAESQSQGRGRLNRKWFSPEGGIYFTLILRPNISPMYAPRINLMVAVAIAQTINKFFGLDAELKWPNDILIGGKKVCGILAEINAETDAINFVNLGIGINANTPISQLEKKATSLKEKLGKEISRKEFFHSAIKEIIKQQTLLTKGDLLEEWRQLSTTLNKNVKIVMPGEEIRGKAIDIDTNGALIIKRADGSLTRVFAGDCIHLCSNTL